MLNTLRAKLDRDYGDFSQLLTAAPTAGGIDTEGLLRDFMFEAWQPHLPATPAGAALTVGLQHAREAVLTLQHFGMSAILNPAGRLFEDLLPLTETQDCRLIFGSPEHLTAYGTPDAVIAIHTLNFFERPAAILQAALSALRPGGKLFIGTPNPASGTRELAQTMGFIKSLQDIPAPLQQAGQLHFFDLPMLRALIADNGFNLLASGGVMLKTLTDAQLLCLINQGLVGEPYLRALNRLGQRLPELCASIWVVAQKPA